jgi:YHS domain-containing protein
MRDTQMNLTRLSTWAFAVLILGGVAGCPGDEPPATSSNPGASNIPKPDKPVVPPSNQPPAAKDAAPKDMQPAAKPGDTPKKPDESPKLEAPKTDAKGDTAAAQLKPDEIAEIKKLPAAEQDQALKQAVCPVSGEHLGEMGKPYKVSAEGRTFFLCCDNCEKEVKSNPKAVIAKLDKK